MNLLNETRNQHFLSQTEQRLNSKNPGANKKNQEIFEFEILSRTEGGMLLSQGVARKISKNMSMDDLFSFEIAKETGLRSNFETLFRRYEAEVEKNTDSLLEKISTGNQEVSNEIKKIYAIKLMSLLRNPYSVVKILNTFGKLADCAPLETEIRHLFNRVINGQREHEQYLCQRIGITNEQYVLWLRLLFNLLVELKSGSRPLLDEIVRDVFTSTQHAIAVLVCTFSKPCCLLSDRSLTTTLNSQSADGFDFNLKSNAFIRYIVMEKPKPTWISPEAFATAINVSAPIELVHEHDHENYLRSFNMNVIAQSHRHVYCATNENLVF